MRCNVQIHVGVPNENLSKPPTQVPACDLVEAHYAVKSSWRIYNKYLSLKQTFIYNFHGKRHKKIESVFEYVS